MKLLVCGGRSFSDVDFLFLCLDRIHEKRGIELLIHGDASGADKLAGEWALARGVPVQKFPADWNGLGRAAGPIRNSYMLKTAKPDGVLAFHGGDGTLDMTSKAQAAGVKVWQPRLGF